MLKAIELEFKLDSDTLQALSIRCVTDICISVAKCVL